jgi:hypothetical protein
MEPQHPGAAEPYRRSADSRMTPEKVFVRGYELEDLKGVVVLHRGLLSAERGTVTEPAGAPGAGRRADGGSGRQRIPGLGHPVFKKVDPRAAIFRSLAVEEGLWTEQVRLYEVIHRAFTARPGKSDIPVDDVGVMAAVLVGLGFTPEETTGLAVISTLPGVVAHISGELAAASPLRIVPDHDVAYEIPGNKDFATDLKEAGWPAAQ